MIKSPGQFVPNCELGINDSCEFNKMPLNVPLAVNEDRKYIRETQVRCTGQGEASSYSVSSSSCFSAAWLTT